MIPEWVRILFVIVVLVVLILNFTKASCIKNLILRATALGLILSLLLLVAPMLWLGGPFDYRLATQTFVLVLQTLMFAIPVYATKVALQKIRMKKNDAV